MEYPKIGIRPVIDGRWGGIREGLEQQTMSMAEAAAKLISENLFYADGKPVKCVIAESTIGGGAEAGACAAKFAGENVTATLSVTPCWCYGSETMDLSADTVKAVWGFNGTERPGAVYLAAALAALTAKLFNIGALILCNDNTPRNITAISFNTHLAKSLVSSARFVNISFSTKKLTISSTAPIVSSGTSPRRINSVSASILNANIGGKAVAPAGFPEKINKPSIIGKAAVIIFESTLTKPVSMAMVILNDENSTTTNAI